LDKRQAPRQRLTHAPRDPGGRPARAVPSAFFASYNAAERRPGSMPRSALVVDDSRAQRSMLKRLLTERGYEVFEAGDGSQGVDHLARLGAVDLVLVDWNMPVMDGLEFIRRPRRRLPRGRMT